MQNTAACVYMLLYLLRGWDQYFDEPGVLYFAAVRAVGGVGLFFPVHDEQRKM